MHRSNFSTILLLITVASMGSWSVRRAHAADVLVGLDVSAAQQVALNQIDHSAWDGLLNKYVDPAGMVQYSAWKSSAADIQALDGYLESLSRSNSQGTHEEQLAFWINAYNAVTIKGILREYPTSSIRNHTARFFGYNIWKNLKLIVAGQPISLDDMEHKILRKMDEPRIHFAIVCASIGCPRLLNEAYTPERVDEQLTQNARHFFADANKFRYDAERNTFLLSPILDWFGKDFGSTQAAQLKRIAAWLPDGQAQQTAAAGSGKMTFLDYDWALNDKK